MRSRSLDRASKAPLLPRARPWPLLTSTCPSQSFYSGGPTEIALLRPSSLWYGNTQRPALDVARALSQRRLVGRSCSAVRASARQVTAVFADPWFTSLICSDSCERSRMLAPAPSEVSRREKCQKNKAKSSTGSIVVF